MAVLIGRHWPVAQLIAAGTDDSRWKLCYQDNEFLIFVRDDLAASIEAKDRTGQFIMGQVP